MKKAILSVLLSALLLCGCSMLTPKTNTGAEKPAPTVDAGVTQAPATPAPTPEPTPTPVPELQFPDGSVHMADETELDLSSLSHKDVAMTVELLRQMPALREVNLGTDGAWSGSPAELTYETASVERPETATRDLSWEDLHALQSAAPEAEFVYKFCFYGREFTTLDEEMDLNHSEMTDNGAAVKEILPLMKRCKYLDMDSCGVPSEVMAEIRDAYPDMEVVWRIWFGYEFTCRTDIELLVDSYFAAGMNDEHTKDLKYLTKVRYLDMGHNRDLHDWSFLGYMPDLEVCVITDSGWEDMEMLADCTNLEFLEVCPIGHTYYDLSPLANLTNLEHLNICGIGESDGWEALLNLTKLKRLWIGHWTASSFPEGAIEKIREALPNTEINTTELAAAVGSWRDDQGNGVPERYILLREQMQYDNYWNIIPLAKNDPKYDPPWYWA